MYIHGLLLTTWVTLCAVSSTPAPAAAAPDLLLRVRSISTPYGSGQPGLQRVFYAGEELQIELNLFNRTSQPVAIGDPRTEHGWTRATEVKVTPLGGDVRDALRITARATHYQVTGKGAAPSDGTTLPPGQQVISGWTLTLNGGPLPVGQYLLQADASRRWPALRSNREIIDVREAVTRTEKLNQLYHHGVRARWGKRYAEAEKKLRELLELCPGSPHAHAELGAVYRDQKDYAKAITAIQNAIEILEAGTLPAEEPGDRVYIEDWLAGLKQGIRTFQSLQQQQQSGSG